jgi:hypothetical protein
VLLKQLLNARFIKDKFKRDGITDRLTGRQSDGRHSRHQYNFCNVVSRSNNLTAKTETNLLPVLQTMAGLWLASG